MTVNEVKKRAKLLGLRSGILRKADLTRTIQTTEGNYPCFNFGQANGEQAECSWRQDCQTN